MAKKASGEREQFWRDLIGRQPSSGLSIASFCDDAGVSANSFFVWKRRLRSQAGDSKRRPASRRRWNRSANSSRPSGHSPTASPLVPVRLIADPVHRQALNAGAIEVEWPDGVVLRVSAECDGRVVRDVVNALAPLLVGDGASC
jgi:transposase-like protein